MDRSMVRFYDNEGETNDRYQAFISSPDKDAVLRYDMSANPMHPQGVGLTEVANDGVTVGGSGVMRAESTGRDPVINFPAQDRLIGWDDLPSGVKIMLSSEWGFNLDDHCPVESNQAGANVRVDVLPANEDQLNQYLQEPHFDLEESWYESGWIKGEDRTELTPRGKQVLQEDRGAIRANLFEWLDETLESAQYDYLANDVLFGVASFDPQDLDQIDELRGEQLNNQVIRRHPEHYPMDEDPSYYENVSDMGKRLLDFSVEFSGADVFERLAARDDLMRTLSSGQYTEDELNRTSWDDIPGEDQRALTAFYGYEPDEFPTDEEFNELYEIWADNQQVVEEPSGASPTP